MPLCQVCGTNMTTSEVTQRRDGMTGNWHTDCAYQDYLADTIAPQSTETWINTILCQKQKLSDKRNGLATEFP
jgi:hypothetical protein